MEHEKITYSPEEAAKAMKVSLSTVLKLCKRHDFPAVRISPRRIVIPIDGLHRWLEANAGKSV